MSFPARYDGRCRSAECHYGDRQISTGDHVEYVDDELMHAVCAYNATDGEPAVIDSSEPCHWCSTYHAGECL